VVVIAVKLDDHLLVAPEKVGGVVADLGVDLGCADVRSAERRQQGFFAIGARFGGGAPGVGCGSEAGDAAAVGVGSEHSVDGRVGCDAFDKRLVQCTLELAVGEVRRDLQDRAGGGRDRDSLVAADVAVIEGGHTVRLDAWPLATGVAADRGHVDETIEGRTKAPRGRGRVVAQERGVAAREDRGQFGSERWQSGERHQ
jgi:hypothetical protein